MRTPKIDISHWTAEGPAYTVSQRVAGWRHRSARRRGEPVPSGVAAYGNSDGEAIHSPDAAIVYQRGEVEVWAFNAGHTYTADLLVDGEEHSALIDARDQISMHEFRDGITLLSWRIEVAGAEPENIDPIDLGAMTDADLSYQEQAEEELAEEEQAEEEQAEDGDYGGTVSDFLENASDIDDDALIGFALNDSRKGIRDAAEREIALRTDA